MFCECVCRETQEDLSPMLVTKINHIFYASASVHMLFLLPILSSVALFSPFSSLSGKLFFFQNTVQASSILNLCLKTEWIIFPSLLLVHSVHRIIIIRDSLSSSTLQPLWGQRPNLFLQHHLLQCPVQQIFILTDQLNRPGEGRSGMSPLRVVHQDILAGVWGWGVRRGLQDWHIHIVKY